MAERWDMSGVSLLKSTEDARRVRALQAALELIAVSVGSSNRSTQLREELEGLETYTTQIMDAMPKT